MLYLATLLRLHSNQGKIRKQIEEKKHQEPFSEILHTPYVSINNLLVEGPD